MPPEITPLISVIVVCKNPDLALREALASIWAQHISPLPELIVVDGSTEDGSRVWLASQRARIAALIMEPDTGIYDAMNKGLTKATGEWVIFLGADDKFVHDGVFNRVQTALKQVTGGVAVGEVAYADGRVQGLAAKPDVMDRNFARLQGTFYRRSLFTEHGTFDPQLALMGHYDFNLRLKNKGVKFEILPLRIASCGVGGRTDSNSWQASQEEIKVRHRHFSALKSGVSDVFSMVDGVKGMFRSKPPAKSAKG